MRNWYIAIGLCAFLCFWGQKYNNVIDKNVYKSGVDFTGEWKVEKIDDRDPIQGETFVINLQKTDGKYIGSYCQIVENGIKRDCPQSQNLTATIEGERLYLLMLSQWGGIVKGYLEIDDIHTLRWRRDQLLGDAFIPKTAILKGKNNLFSETEIYLIPPLKEENIGDYKKAKLSDSHIKLNIYTNLSNSHYLAEIKSNISRIQTFLFSDCNKENECNRYLVTVNSEGVAIGILELTSQTTLIDAKTNTVEKVESYEIDKDFIISLTVNRYKKGRKSNTYKKLYQINDRGEIEEITSDKL